MTWSQQQVAMLAEMGIRLWLPATPAIDPKRAEAPSADPAPTAHNGTMPFATALRTGGERKSTPPATPGRAEPRSRPSGVDSMDWPSLRAAVAACTACKLCETRRQTVFGVGHESAQWMIIGEAPGEQEDRQGEPFVGKAGQLLDNMLHAVGLTRQPAAPERQVFIANTLKCRPPGNRNPEPEELAQCEPFLRRQIALVRPRIIVAMGRFAVQSLLRTTDAIGRLRGRTHTYEGVPLVVTYHPAYLLRNPQDKARAWEDLCLARDVLTGHSPR